MKSAVRKYDHVFKNIDKHRNMVLYRVATSRPLGEPSEHFFGRKAADRERNPTKDFFESLSTFVQWKKFLTLSSKLGMKTTLSKQENALAETVC